MDPIFLLPREDRRLVAGHLWAFSNEIDWKRASRPEPGETRLLFSAQGRDLGLADTHPGTLIAARLQPLLPSADPDASWWNETLSRLRKNRLAWMREDKFCRLVNADADLLPGLTIDLFGDTAVVAAQTAAMERRAPVIAEALLAMGFAGVRRIGGTRARELEGLSPEDVWHGTPCDMAWVPLAEGVVAAAPLASGQKTGFFLDQAQNRRFVAPLAEGGSALDVCCYTGGWGLCMAQAGAKNVAFVDGDAKALGLVREGWTRSGLAGAPELLEGDAFKVLESLATEGRTFDTVVLDPPAFAKSRKTIEQALAGYHKLARLGLRVLAPGGTLVTCSCSGLVDPDDFRQAVGQAFRKERRPARLLAYRGAAPDHPVHPAMIETEYLKVLVWSVD